MLDEERIKKAQANISSYLADGFIRKVKLSRKEVLECYKRNYKESIELADKLFEESSSNLWIIVISYYSMFYITNAVLYKIGYKIGDRIVHKITADALVFYIRNRLKKALLEDYEAAEEEALGIIGRKTDEIISDYDRELDKRSIFQYETTEEVKRSKAKTSLERAKRFVFEMEKLLLSVQK